jgi:murein L,D-transpeptidase YcbB/YkuD
VWTVIAAATTHPAVEYVIHGTRIYRRAAKYRPETYLGTPHTGHIHISIQQTPAAEQYTLPWTTLTRPPWPTMRRGGTGAPVRELQAYLNAAGANLTPDGVFGPLTEATVKAFQTRYKVTLGADGIVGTYTARALRGR